jgi:hypothetical protein
VCVQNKLLLLVVLATKNNNWHPTQQQVWPVKCIMYIRPGGVIVHLLVLVLVLVLSLSAVTEEEDWHRAKTRWALDLYVVSENVKTFNSPYLPSGLYQHTTGTSPLEITKMFATGSINLVGVSLKSGLISFFRSVSPPLEEDLVNLLVYLDLSDTLLILYTHEFDSVVHQSEAFSVLLQFCGSEGFELPGDAAYSFVFIGQCSASPWKRNAWKEYLSPDYLPIRIQALSYWDEFQNQSHPIVRVSADVVSVSDFGAIRFKRPTFREHAGFQVEVTIVHEDGSRHESLERFCANEKV